MSDQTPFFLAEAVLTFYRTAAGGGALSGAAIWAGGLANGLRMKFDYEEVALAASGDPFKTAHHVDEEHVLEMARSWFIRKTDARDFKPGRNEQYVLDIVWQSGGHWYRRTYFGVTGRGVALDSQGTNHFQSSETYRAQYFTKAGGSGSPDVYVPALDDEAWPVAFFRELPLVVGDYLLGHYRWQEAVTLGTGRLIAWNSAVSPTVLTLEVNGALTALTVTIPVGAPNAEVTVDLALGNYPVAAGQSVRWQITSGPATINAASAASLEMLVQPA